MFANTNGNGNGKFSFTSTRQLKDKAFTADVSYIENLLKNAGTASESNAQTATDGQAGVLTTNGKTYLFDANGVDVVELCEKIMMGAVFMNQALNVYFGESKMNVDNTTAVDAANGKFYTTMQHHWDEAFGYFGVSTDFPTTIPTSFWGKYCNTQNGTINSNVDMMSNFLKGRAAIGANKLQDRDAAILAIRKEWEEIAANQAITYLNTAISAFGNDQAQFLHVLAEAYAFCYNLKYSPESTRRLSPTEHSALMAMFPDNFWETTVSDLNDIKAALDTKY